jgi:hypothetical protein
MTLKKASLNVVVAVCLMGAGCGDEDSPMGSDGSNIGTLRLSGHMTLSYEYLSFNGTLFSIDGLLPQVDSVTFHRSVCSQDTFWNSNQGYFISAYGLSFIQNGAYTSGDTADIHVFSPLGYSTIKTKLLDRNADAVRIHDWADSSYVDTGTELSIAWDTIPNADWYLVDYYTRYWDETIGFTRSDWDQIIVPRCSVAISSTQTKHNGYWSVAIFAVTGPRLLSSSGTGGDQVCQGVVNSITSERLTIFVGDGNPYGPDSSAVTTSSRHRQTAEASLERFRRNESALRGQ